MLKWTPTDMQDLLPKEERSGYGSDSSACSVFWGADLEDILEDGQQDEVHAVSYPEMPAQVTEEMVNGFWDALAVASLNQCLQSCAPAPVFPSRLVQNAARDNHV